MRKFLIYITIALSIGSLESCNKFLDVKPADKILDDQVFSSKKNIENALNGIYISMADDALYGANLTKSTIDVLAQYYATNSNGIGGNYADFGDYSWSSSVTQGQMLEVWTQSYAAILNTNVFINNLKNVNANVLSASEKDILLGESFAIRAFLHFDLFRIFGPIYTMDSTSKAIPYKYATVSRTDSVLSSKRVMDNVFNDLDSALLLLKNDPIIAEGIVPLQTDDDDFLRMRNRRMNYYAVLSLEARAKLYAGRKAEANALAKRVITATQKIFPWNNPSQSQGNAKNSDRIFSTEVIFGLYDFNMYNDQLDFFAADLQDYALLAPTPAVLNNYFESNTSDYRFRSQFAVDASSSRSIKTFSKYQDVDDKTLSFRYLQPLIRISELYYIVAETESDLASASSYLNKVRFNRGLINVDLTSQTMKSAEIQKEYIKEFWGEGQTFFYYKRNNLQTITNGSSSNASSRSMTLTNYRAPLPTTEQQFQN